MENRKQVIFTLYLKNSTNAELCEDMIGALCDFAIPSLGKSQKIDDAEVIALLPSSDLVNRNSKTRLVRRSRQELQDFYLDKIEKTQLHNVSISIDLQYFVSLSF